MYFQGKFSVKPNIFWELALFGEFPKTEKGFSVFTLFHCEIETVKCEY